MNDPQLEPDCPADPETAAKVWKTESGNGIEVSYDPACWPEESLGHFAQTHIAACAAALIETGNAGEAMTPLYLAPAFLGPTKQAGK